jgi:epoxyqueuosine reductase QueG
MYERIEKEASELGFARVYFLPRKRLDTWEARAKQTGHGTKLFGDVAAAYPNAGCIALLVYPYRPFTREERIPAYYFYSNAAYHAAKTLKERLQAMGIVCEDANIPYRALAHACGIGTIGKNGLLRIAPYGSRIVMQALAIEGLAPREESDHTPPCPANCTACMHECPTGAIVREGLFVGRCMRTQMSAALRSDEIKRLSCYHLGCERCLYACPFNAALEAQTPDDATHEAFELRRLILGDTAAARALVGKNNTTQGKLTAEAIVFAARQGLYEGEIRAALDSPFEAVREAALWAISAYFS